MSLEIEGFGSYASSQYPETKASLLAESRERHAALEAFANLEQAFSATQTEEVTSQEKIQNLEKGLSLLTQTVDTLFETRTFLAGSPQEEQKLTEREALLLQKMRQQLEEITKSSSTEKALKKRCDKLSSSMQAAEVEAQIRSKVNTLHKHLSRLDLQRKKIAGLWFDFSSSALDDTMKTLLSILELLAKHHNSIKNEQLKQISKELDIAQEAIFSFVTTASNIMKIEVDEISETSEKLSEEQKKACSLLVEEITEFLQQVRVLESSRSETLRTLEQEHKKNLPLMILLNKYQNIKKLLNIDPENRFVILSLSSLSKKLPAFPPPLSPQERHHGFSLYLIDPTFPTSNWLPGFETTNFLTTKFCIPQIFS